MKILKSISVLILLAFFALSGCIKKVIETPDHAIKLTFDTVRLTQGITQYLAAKNYNADEINWSSSDTSIVKIDEFGVINAIKPGQAIITAKSKVYTVSAKCVVIVSGNAISETKVSDVGVGADGSIFVIGTDVVSPTGGFGIYKVVGDKFNKLPYCAGVRIAVGPDGKPWVVNKSHLIFKYRDSTSSWQQLPGTANDIAVGADGSVYAIGTVQSSATGGFNVMKWNGNSWNNLPDCAGVHIAVDATGIPWVVNFSHIVFKYDGSYLWKTVGSVSANDIGIGADGSAYITGDDVAGTVYKLNIPAQWTSLQGKYGTSIAVMPTGQPVYIDLAGTLHKP